MPTFQSARLNRIIANLALSGAIFLLALLPRAYDLARFVTADEAKWVYRSAQFAGALLRGDFAATSVNLTPGVTTTWVGSVGLGWYYWCNPVPGLSLADWLATLPEFRAELPVLVATRWPGVLLASLLVVALYWQARALVASNVALAAAIFIALDPHLVALSRVLGHDIWAALFASVSLLGLLLAVQRRENWWYFGLSGGAAGLAFLSKAPVLFLLPFAGLIFLALVARQPSKFGFWLARFGLWGAVAYLTFVVVWPAAWVEPLGRPWAVVENAFLSATDKEEADAESYWQTPDLGPWYYLVYGGFKLSPLVVAGVGLAAGLGAMRLRRRGDVNWRNWLDSPLFWLLAFVMLFTVFMTLGGKRSARYILPAFPALALLAAAGWDRFFNLTLAYGPGNSLAKNGLRRLYQGSLAAAALLVLLPVAPYYITYFNPLLGGAKTAPALIKIGWGEGLDQVGRFLQRELPNRRVGTAYASTVAPFYGGDLAAVTADNLDFLVLYLKQVQSGEPSPAFVRYFEQVGPVFSVDLHGLHYADVYAGPALKLLAEAESGQNPAPVGYRPLTTYGRIGEPLNVDVVWSNAATLPANPATVLLKPAVENQPVVEGAAPLARLADDLAVSHHQLLLPADLPRGDYALSLGDQPLGKIELRRFQMPSNLTPVQNVVFGGQAALLGYQFEPSKDYLAVTLAWQARQAHLPDYTVFVQVLDAATGARVAGVDTPPQQGEYPTGRWVKDEVVVDRYVVAVPPQLAPGHYTIVVGLYRADTGQRLAVNGGPDYWLLPWTFIWKG